MKVIGVYRKCDFVTMLGTTFALSGILLSIHHKTMLAIFCLIFAAICDAFDGVVARKGKNTKEQTTYGVELDSLSDAISFGVLPMLIVQNLSHPSIYLYVISIFFCLAGIIRLAYFNMLSITGKSNGKEFIGLPITASAIILPAVYFIVKLLRIKVGYIVFPITLLITGMLFISPFKLKKLTNREKVLFSVLGVVAIAVCILRIVLITK